MKKFNYINSAKKTFKIEAEAINNLSRQIDKDFVSLCDAIILNDGVISMHDLIQARIL